MSILKITAVKYWRENLQLTKPYTIAFNTIDSVENIFVSLELDGNIVGIGACSPARFITGESVDSAEARLELHLEELLLGQDIRHIHALIYRAQALLKGFPGAMAAIDIALHDAFTQYLDIPLVDYWGRMHQSLPTSITIGILSVEETLQEAREHLAEGFKVIKLKLGNDLERDIETFARLRELAGPDIKIRVDANQGYTVDDFLAFEQATRHLAVEFFEQPFPTNHLEWMHQLPKSLRKSIAADEDLHFPDDVFRFGVSDPLYGIFNIKLMKCGGLTNGRRIAQYARDLNVDVMWGCMDESRVSIAAALHLAFASPATKYLDLDGSFDLARDVATGGFILKDGIMHLNNQPGLGLKIN